MILIAEKPIALLVIFFKDGEQTKKLDMGIIYSDVIKLDNNKAKFVSRDFKLIWSNTIDVL